MKLKKLAILLFVDSFDYWRPSPKYELCVGFETKDLSKLAEHLDKNDSLTALIKGHTDSTGLEEYNLELSQRRAEAVKKYLVSLGIDPNRINAKGMGSAESKADNSTLEGRLMNRRVEVILESTIRKTRTIKPNPIAIDSIPITSDTSKNKSNVQ